MILSDYNIFLIVILVKEFNQYTLYTDNVTIVYTVNQLPNATFVNKTDSFNYFKVIHIINYD